MKTITVNEAQEHLLELIQFALYLPEPLSSKARAVVEQYGQPLLLDQLQELEFRNGMRQKVFRGEVEEAKAVYSLRIFDDDCVLGKIEHKNIFWDAVFTKAEDISRRFALRRNCRAFDLLHVAIPALSEANRFATFDCEQSGIALAAGLQIVEFPCVTARQSLESN